MRQIDVYTYAGKGYNPFLIDKDWQIAQLNYEEGQGLHDLKKIDKHLLTDEAFILKKGIAILISAVLDSHDVTFEVVKMEEGVVYNIPKGVWHNIALSTDAEVFIVEKSYTHLSDFEYFYLSEEAVQRLNSLIDDACGDM